METNKNALGLDKLQMSIIKNNYNSIKPILAKREKLQAKVEQAKTKLNENKVKLQEFIDKKLKEFQEKFEESIKETLEIMNAYNTQISAIDELTNSITLKACGLALSSEQCIKLENNPDAFEEFKQKQQGIPGDLFSEEPVDVPMTEVGNDFDLDAQEDQDWEDRIQAGVLNTVE